MDARFAWFGPRAVPPGGFCASSFVLLIKKGSVLVGKVKNPELWYDEFPLNRVKPETWMSRWRLPATHLKFDEHPDDAARRVLEKQLGLRSYNLSLLEIQSHTGESTIYPGETHWDICFVYKAETSEEARPTEYFSELIYMEIDKIGPDDLGSGHGWVIESLKRRE